MARLTVQTDVAMSTRDGVRLLADVYRLDDEQRRPALLLRTPYDKSNPLFISGIVVDPLWLARRGYVVVVQDVRGRYASAGDYDFFVQEQDDGYDAVEWTAAQDWCNGRVGIYGSSYHAMSALAAVAAQPPHLQAAMALVGAPGVGPTVRPGGLFELGFLSMYCLTQSPDTIARSAAAPADKVALISALQAVVADPLAAVAHLPITDIAVVGDNTAVPWWKDWLHAEPDDDYWRTDTLVGDPDRVGVPLLQVAGFMDFLSPPMIDLYQRIQHDPRHALVVGPWTHYGTYTGSVGGLDVRTTAGGGPGTLGPMVAAWFDRWLRDVDSPTAPPVRYFSTGDLQWRTSASWPPSAHELVLYLSSAADNASVNASVNVNVNVNVNANANANAGNGATDVGGVLAAAPGGPPDHVAYDPLAPVPTCGGMLASPLLGPDGVQDQSAIGRRPDVLVYTSAPLTEPLRIVGTPTVTVHLQTTVEDTDLVATVIDVGTDAAVNVCEGALRARYRNGGHDAWLVPGVIIELTVTLHRTAHTFGVGHRIRLHLTSSNFPRLSRNLNTRVVPELGVTGDAVVAEHTVHHDEQHPSRLVLPRADDDG